MSTPYDWAFGNVLFWLPYEYGLWTDYDFNAPPRRESFTPSPPLQQLNPYRHTETLIESVVSMAIGDEPATTPRTDSAEQREQDQSDDTDWRSIERELRIIIDDTNHFPEGSHQERLLMFAERAWYDFSISSDEGSRDACPGLEILQENGEELYSAIEHQAEHPNYPQNIYLPPDDPRAPPSGNSSSSGNSPLPPRRQNPILRILLLEVPLPGNPFCILCEGKSVFCDPLHRQFR